MKLYHSFIYVKGKTVLKVIAKKRPSLESMPKSGTWVIRILFKNGWMMPCFPEILWETLKKFTYLGELIEKV